MYNAKGELVWHATLDIYGRITVKKGDKYDCPFRYQGQYEDRETGGLYYNRFRYYDSNTGLYISQDPIGFVSGELNLYSYTVDSNRELDIYGRCIKGNNVAYATVWLIHYKHLPDVYLTLCPHFYIKDNTMIKR
ncbi:RHS repeat-associated core domain-containing protein [Myroides marinus]|nr:RHS repeat-associated core domain-containing protein [Myroides marinus]MDM1359251.1 RHS repeat-associated core domain-containing protein [Myroides marinus]